MISLICVAATISGIFLFVNNKKKNQEFLFNIQKAQKLINNKLDIEYYTSEMFLETKKQINVILKDFSNINLKSIFTSFNQECNLLLNIVIECNNQEYKLIKKLRYWSINDLGLLFNFSIDNENNIILNKYKNPNLKKIVLPNFIFEKENKLKIVKVQKNTFINEMEELDFSNNDFIELEQNWINNHIDKLVININDNNIDSIARINVLELWINALSLTNNTTLNANNIYINNKVNETQFAKLSNHFLLFSVLNYDDVSINFSYINNNDIIINSISSKKELERYLLFDYLFINNRKWKIWKWSKKSLSKLQSKIIDASHIMIENEGVFENNNYVEEIILNTKQKKITKCLFQNCEKLSIVKNTSNIEFIYNYAFNNCVNLKYFYVGKEIKFIDKIAFLNIDPTTTKIIYHKSKAHIVKNIIYQDSLEEIININELAEVSSFNIKDNFIEIIKFNNNNQTINSSLVEYNNTILKIKKINYIFNESNNNNIDIVVPTFTELINFGDFKFKINKLVLPRLFKLKNIINYPSSSINMLIMPEDTTGLKLRSYCEIIIFKPYANILEFDYDYRWVSSFQWELPIINKEYINKIKFNKWSNLFKEAKLEIINKFKNDYLIQFLIELNKYKKNIIFTNIMQK